MPGATHDEDAATQVAALYETHADLVYRNLIRLGARASDAADLLQETFLVVHRRWSELDPSQPVEGWLWGVAVGLVRNYRRRAFRRSEQNDVGIEAFHEVTPELDLVRARQRRDIARAIDALDPEKRAVFVMFEIEGLTGQGIATSLGLPIGTVHSRLFAARRELTAALAEHASSRAEEAPR
jgi:RNA polymerase sigma-70 factor (ECF subfamily)